MPRRPQQLAPHGTYQRYNQGCREACCRRANALNQNLYRLGRTAHRVDGHGTRRRIRALRRIGWRNEDIATAAGLGRASIARLLHTTRDGSLVVTSTAAAVRRAYDTLSMSRGPSEHAARLAIREGWPSPLAWDDDMIDDPQAKPYRPRSKGANPELARVDQVVVERALAGQAVHATMAERAEIVQRWRALGRSLAELDRLQGWNVHRDRRTAAA